MAIISEILVYSVLIPILVGAFAYKKLDAYSKLFLLSILCSLLVEPIAIFYAMKYGNNFLPYTIYDWINAIVLVLAWLQIKDYNRSDRKLIIIILAFSLAMMVSSFLLDFDGLISYSINLFLGLVLGLHYYYAKLFKEEITESLIDPVFIFSSALILNCISSIVFNSSMIIFGEEMNEVWNYRQFFFLFYNVILALGFTLYLKKEI